MMQRAPIAITGVGLVSCLGLDADAAWEAVCSGRPAMRPFTQCESPLPAGRRGGEAPDPPAGAAPDQPREIRLLRHAIESALKQSSILAHHRLAPERVAAVLGTTLHGMRRGGEFLRTGEHARLRTFLAAPTVLGALHGLPVRGPVLGNCSACSSGLSAVALGATLLEAGLSDAVIAGGYDPVSEYAIGGFGSLRLLAAEALRPFCSGRDGMMLSEAYAVLILERAEDARSRGAEMLGAVRGFAESSDAHHLTQPHPEGEGAARALAGAIEDGGLGRDSVGLIAAHATGTPNNDAAEYAALRAVFDHRLARTPVVAFKSHLGHSLGAAGAAELILSLRALQSGLVPPTANARPAELEFPGLSLGTDRPSPAPVDSTVNISLGFGGANTCMVLAPRPPSATAVPSLREVLITGVGVVLPGTVGSAALRARIAENRPVTEDTGSVSGELFAHLVNARRIRRLSDYVKVTLAAAADACADAAIVDVPAFMARCHGILGTMTGATAFCEAYYRQILEQGIDAANPMLFAEGVPNAGAAHLSMTLGIKGGCQSIIGSRTAGLDALGLAWARIATGRWDRAIVGAGEEYSPFISRTLEECGLHGRPASPPYQGTRGGPVGAGAVALVLESRSSAEERGARPRACVRAWHARSATGDTSLTDAVADAVSHLGSLSHFVSSANGSWLDRAEVDGIARAGQGRLLHVGTSVGAFAETLSVTPLTGLAGLIATGRLPAVRAAEPRLPTRVHAASGDEQIMEAGVVCTDPAGLASAVAVSLG